MPDFHPLSNERPAYRVCEETDWMIQFWNVFKQRWEVEFDDNEKDTEDGVCYSETDWRLETNKPIWLGWLATKDDPCFKTNCPPDFGGCEEG